MISGRLLSVDTPDLLQACGRAVLCDFVLSLNEKKTCQDRLLRYAARSLFSIGPMSYTFRWSAEGFAERLYC